MRTDELSKYVKSRMSNCIFCGKPITENQDFQYCSAKQGRFVAYVFIHSDCIPEAQRYLQNVERGKKDDIRIDSVKVSG